MRGFFFTCLILLNAHIFAQINNEGYSTRTTGKLSMLSYGLGEDRLGGAKAGYLDSGILLQVIDSVKDVYLIKLSTGHQAYISKSDVIKDLQIKRKPFYLTNSWSIKGDEIFDYVNISLDEKLPYKSWMEVNSSKIIIEIYGVQSNSNWLSHLRSIKEIKDVYFTQVEDDVVRINIDLKHKQHWGYSINYSGKTLSIRVRHQPEALRIKKLLIAIDPGHGGTNEGAKGIGSASVEKNYTLRFANELEKLLHKKKVEVIMTRNTDTTINQIERVTLLQARMPDLLISLHLNSSSNNQVKGVSTYYKHIGFKQLSVAILQRMLQLNMGEFGVVGNFNAMISAPTDFPNSLVEIGFISNPDDEKKIMDPRFQRATARQIYKGIKDWLKLAKQ